MTITLDNKLRKSACFYAKQFGWKVFPLHSIVDGRCSCGKDCNSPGKHPRTQNGVKDASSRQPDIMAWWNTYPDANIGIATGEDSGIVVLDVDKDTGGYDSLDVLFKEHPYQTTPEVLTGSGGNHIYYKYPEGKDIRNSASKVAPGIDIRGNGGYVVAPPSNHRKGDYVWDIALRPHETPLAPLPEFLIKRLETRAVATADVLPMSATGEANRGTIPQIGNEAKSFIAFGAPVGQQRSKALTTARNLLASGASIEHTADKVWQGLQNSEQEKGRSPWKYEDAMKIVSDLASKPAPPAPTERVDGIAKKYIGKRRDIEIMFAASVMKSSDVALQKAGWLNERNIMNEAVRMFWRRVKNGEDSATVASDVGLLAELMTWQNVVSAEDVSQHASNVLDAGFTYHVSKALPIIGSAIGEMNAEKVRTLIRELDEKGSMATPGNMGSTSTQSLLKLSDVTAQPGTRMIKTGFPIFNRKLGGIERQMLCILAARPGVGKTTFLFQMARESALRGNKVLFLSLEMPEENLWGKAVCATLGLEWLDIVDGRLSREKRVQVAMEIEKWIDMYKDKVIVDDSTVSLETLWRTIAHHKPDLVVIDHLGLVKGLYEVPQAQRLGIITSGMKDIAKQFECGIICVHQMNRGVEGRDDKFPRLADLRDSGRVEEDADVVFFLHREDYYDQLEYQHVDDYSETWLIAAKVRYGTPNQRIVYRFDLRNQHFSEKTI